MPRLRLLLVFAAVVLAMTCAPAAARAQSILSNIPDRITAQGDLGQTTRPDTQNPLGISYADCVADMTLRFAVQLSGFGGHASLQVWASLGSGCVAPQDRGLDGGTAKPTAQQRDAVRHHLLDVVAPDEDWSAARTQQCGRAAVGEIEARGHRAMLVGGTGL